MKFKEDDGMKPRKTAIEVSGTHGHLTLIYPVYTIYIHFRRTYGNSRHRTVAEVQR